MPRRRAHITGTTGQYGLSLAALRRGLTRRDRNARGRHSSSGVVSDHGSLHRGFEFFAGEISSGVIRIPVGQASAQKLGNLEARRDRHALV